MANFLWLRFSLYSGLVVFWPVLPESADDIRQSAVPAPVWPWRNFWPHFVFSKFLRKSHFLLSVVLISWPVCRKTAENVGETAVRGPVSTWRNFWPHFVFSYFLRKLLFILSVVLKSWPVWLETAENVRETAVPAKPVKFSIRRSKRESSASKNSFSKYVPRNYLRLTQARQIAPSRFAYPPFPLYLTLTS